MSGRELVEARDDRPRKRTNLAPSTTMAPPDGHRVIENRPAAKGSELPFTPSTNKVERFNVQRFTSYKFASAQQLLPVITPPAVLLGLILFLSPFGNDLLLDLGVGMLVASISFFCFVDWGWSGGILRFRPSIILLTKGTWIGLMLGTLVGVSSYFGPIATWQSFNVATYFRLSVWFVGTLLLFPDLIPRFFRVRLSWSSRLVVSVPLSLLAVGSITLVVFDEGWPRLITPVVILTCAAAAVGLDWLRRAEWRPVEYRVNFVNVALALACLTCIAISLPVIFANPFQIPGDNWTALRPGVAMFSGTSPSTVGAAIQYPVMFGVIAFGLGNAWGVPLANSAMTLSILSFLPLLAVYEVSLRVFSLSSRLSALAGFLFVTIGGALPLVWGTVLRTPSYWLASYDTHDGLFSGLMWFGSFPFDYKSLCLVAALGALVSFFLAAKASQRGELAFWLGAASSFIVATITIHLLEAVLFGVLLGPIFFSERRKIWLRNVAISGTAAGAGLLALNFALGGFYFQLFSDKANLLHLSYDVWIAIILGLLVLASIPFLWPLFRKKATFEVKIRLPPPKPGVAKWIHKDWELSLILVEIPLILTLIYWFPNPEYPLLPTPLYNANQYPWQYFLTEFGVLAVLGCLGVPILLREWQTCGPWLAGAATIFLISEAWWGGRFIEYFQLFLAAAGSIAFGVYVLGYPANSPITRPKTRIRPRTLRRGARPAIGAVILAIGCSSLVVLTGYWTFDTTPTQNSQVYGFAWVEEHTTPAQSVLAPDAYNWQHGILAYSDRTPLDWNSTLGPIPSEDVPRDLRALNVGASVEGEICEEIGLCALAAFSPTTQASDGAELSTLSYISQLEKSAAVGLLNGTLVGYSGLQGTPEWSASDPFTGWRWVDSTALLEPTDLLFVSHEYQGEQFPAPTGTVSLTSNLTVAAGDVVTVEYSDATNNSLDAVVNLDLGSLNGGPHIDFQLPVAPSLQEVSFVIPTALNFGQVSIWFNNVKHATGFFGFNLGYVAIFPPQVTHSPLDSTFGLGLLSALIPSLLSENYETFGPSGTAPTVVMPFLSSSLPILNGFVNRSGVQTVISVGSSTEMGAIPTPWVSVGPAVYLGYLDSVKLIFLAYNQFIASNEIGSAGLRSTLLEAMSVAPGTGTPI